MTGSGPSATEQQTQSLRTSLHVVTKPGTRQSAAERNALVVTVPVRLLALATSKANSLGSLCDP